MKTYGQTGTYVSATGPIDLPRPKRRKHRPARQRHVCTSCTLPLVRPDAFHLCLDLSQPEPVVVRLVKASPKPSAARRSSQRQYVASKAAKKACANCGKKGISVNSTRCKPCGDASRRAIGPEREAEIIDLYVNRFWSAKKIATHAGVSQFAIAAVLDRNGVEKGHNRGGGAWRAITPEQTQQIIDTYARLQSALGTAREVGLSEKTVRKALSARGLITPTKGRTNISMRSFTPEQEVGLAAAYRNGGTIIGLSRIHGASQPTVREALVRQGVTLRKQGQRAS